MLSGEQTYSGRKVGSEVPCKAVTKSEVSVCEEEAEGLGTVLSNMQSTQQSHSILTSDKLLKALLHL